MASPCTRSKRTMVKVRNGRELGNGVPHAICLLSSSFDGVPYVVKDPVKDAPQYLGMHNKGHHRHARGAPIDSMVAQEELSKIEARRKYRPTTICIDITPNRGSIVGKLSHNPTRLWRFDPNIGWHPAATECFIMYRFDLCNHKPQKIARCLPLYLIINPQITQLSLTHQNLGGDVLSLYHTGPKLCN